MRMILLMDVMCFFSKFDVGLFVCVVGMVCWVCWCVVDVCLSEV